jgi:hypothetical protein
MQFIHFTKDPRTLLRLGMFFLVLALIGNRFWQPSPGLRLDCKDGLVGLLFGFSFALNILAVSRGRRDRSCG